MAYIVKVDGNEFKVDLSQDGKEFFGSLNGKDMKIELAHKEGNQLTLIINNKPFTVVLESDDHIVVNDEIYSVEVVDEQISKLIKASPERSHKREMAIKAPMPGLIIEVEVKEGNQVQKGQGLLIVEAMKMQNEMNAPSDGIVKKILVEKGRTVNSGDTLIIIE